MQPPKTCALSSAFHALTMASLVVVSGGCARFGYSMLPNAEQSPAGDAMPGIAKGDASSPGGSVQGASVQDAGIELDATNDLCPEDDTKFTPGVCGCGLADTDSDADGTPACIDECDGDPDKLTEGQCGCGLPDTDTDGDGTPDCQDICGAPPGPDAVVQVSDGNVKTLYPNGDFFVNGTLAGTGGTWISSIRYKVFVAGWSGGLWWVGELTTDGMHTATTRNEAEASTLPLGRLERHLCP